MESIKSNQENKYYTPSTEDIRVGYECEISEKRPAPNDTWEIVNWHTITLNPGLVREILLFETQSSLRVSYLTKEQIEVEGWKIDKVYDSSCMIFKLGDWSLVFWPNKKGAFIELERTDEYTYSYIGDCPSINEFRTITKLLNIQIYQNAKIKNQN